jgi:serine/threonine protein kinase
MIVGFPPFFTGNRRNTMMFKKIKNQDVYLDVEKHGITMSDECKSFIKALLEKDPNRRMGSVHDFKDLVDHPWLQELDGDKIAMRKVEAPYIPNLDSHNLLDTSNFD